MFFYDRDAGFPIRCHFAGKLFNLRRLQAKSKVQTDVLDKLMYAADMADDAKNRDKKNASVCRSSFTSM